MVYLKLLTVSLLLELAAGSDLSFMCVIKVMRMTRPSKHRCRGIVSASLFAPFHDGVEYYNCCDAVNVYRIHGWKSSFYVGGMMR